MGLVCMSLFDNSLHIPVSSAPPILAAVQQANGHDAENGKSKEHMFTPNADVSFLQEKPLVFILSSLCNLFFDHMQDIFLLSRAREL